jgi:hypothetical protein
VAGGGGCNGCVAAATADIYRPAVVRPAAALLTAPGDTASRGAILHAESHQEVTTNNPAAAGEALEIYGSGLIEGSVVLGSTRYRQHNGYATQTGNGADFYASAFLTSAPQVLQGQAKTKTPPIAFIVNEHSPSFAEILGGLQASGRAFVIQEGQQAPASGGAPFTITLPESTTHAVA